MISAAELRRAQAEPIAVPQSVCCVSPSEMDDMKRKSPGVVGIPTCWSDDRRLFPEPAPEIFVDAHVVRQDPQYGEYVSLEPWDEIGSLGNKEHIVGVRARKIKGAASAERTIVCIDPTLIHSGGPMTVSWSGQQDFLSWGEPETSILAITRDVARGT